MQWSKYSKNPQYRAYGESKMTRYGGHGILIGVLQYTEKNGGKNGGPVFGGHGIWGRGRYSGGFTVYIYRKKLHSYINLYKFR